MTIYEKGKIKVQEIQQYQYISEESIRKEVVMGYPETDMQKVEILPPADFQVKISAKEQNQTLLLGFMNFRQFS